MSLQLIEVHNLGYADEYVTKNFNYWHHSHMIFVASKGYPDTKVESQRLCWIESKIWNPFTIHHSEIHLSSTTLFAVAFIVIVCIIIP